METWRKYFRIDPLPALIDAADPGIRFFAVRDLLGKAISPEDVLWELPGAQRLVLRQLPDGSWKYPNPRKERASEDYGQLETFRSLGILVEKFGFDRRHPSIQKAAQYFFSKQTPEGDLRGIYGRQYTPNYTAAILELLIKAGFVEEEPIERGLRWLLQYRQDDGGWAIPLRTHKATLYAILVDQPPLEPDRARPSSHTVTGIVMRAFAAHPAYRSDPAVQTAARWLASRFFKADHYPDRQAPEYWTRFSFPYWFSDLLCVLDSLAQLGFRPDQPDVQRGLTWFVDRQQPDGAWQLKLLRDKDEALPLWIQLNICRVFKKFYDGVQKP